MKLTSEDHPERFKATSLLLDEEEWKIVYCKFAKGFLSKLKTCQSLEELQEKFNQIEYERGKNYALWLLGEKGGTRKGLEAKLRNKYLSENAIKTILDDCVDLGYLNDEAWASSFIRLQKQKKYGKKVIAQKLRMKGIEGSLIEHLLEEDESSNETEQVRELLEGKYRNRLLSDPKEKAKTIAAIIRRGYGPHLVMDLVRECADTRRVDDEFCC